MAVSRRTVRSRDEEIEDEEEVEETPKRRRRPRDEEPDEDERPAKRRRRARDDDDDEDEDDDEQPRRRGGSKGGKAKRPTGSVRSGWKGAKENKAKGGDFAEELGVSKEPELIKFLEDEPYASYRQHWVDNPPAGIKKKSYICIEDDCPLCDLGDRPRTLTAFNILHVSNGGTPDNKILVLGNKALSQVEAFSEDKKTGPLSKLFWAVSKSGKGAATAYNFVPVKERDLEEDWDLDPDEVADAVEDAEGNLYTPEDIQVPTRKQLREVSSGLMDDDEDDDEDDD